MLNQNLFTLDVKLTKVKKILFLFIIDIPVFIFFNCKSKLFWNSRFFAILIIQTYVFTIIINQWSLRCAPVHTSVHEIILLCTEKSVK